MHGRLSQTARDMVLSIGAVIGLVAIFMFFTYSPADETIKVVDYQPTATAARASGAFDVAVPSGAATSEWKATSVRYVPIGTDGKVATWHIGFLTPEDQYVGLEQSNSTDLAFVKEATATGKPQGEEMVNGKPWARYLSASTGYRSLVSTTDSVTTVVTGTVSYAELATFAGSLRTS